LNTKQKALLDKARQSINASQILVDQGFYNFAVSRGYYAMFYIAEALLDNEGMSFSSHSAVTSAFGRHITQAGKVPVEFHRYLIDAQTQRTLADYETDLSFSQEDAEEIIDRAEELLAIATQNLTG
jgi:uncharacterized protein (UPF0332 family)